MLWGSHYQHVNWNSQNLGQRWLELMWNSGKKALGDLLWGNGLRCVHALRCFPPALLLPCQPSLPHLLLSSAPFRFDQMAGKYKSPYFFVFIWLCNSLHTPLNQIEHFTRAPATKVRQHVEASLKGCSNSYHMPPPPFFSCLSFPCFSLSLCHFQKIP